MVCVKALEDGRPPGFSDSTTRSIDWKSQRIDHLDVPRGSFVLNDRRSLSAPARCYTAPKNLINISPNEEPPPVTSFLS